MQLTIDTSKLIPGTWDMSKITVTSSVWALPGALAEVQLTNPVGSVYTFNLSQYSGAGKALSHSGLPSSGTKAVFGFLFNGKPYRDTSNVAATGGVGAATKAAGTVAYTAAPVALNAANDTYITIP